jgi:hypothetical protein
MSYSVSGHHWCKPRLSLYRLRSAAFLRVNCSNTKFWIHASFYARGCPSHPSFRRQFVAITPPSRGAILQHGDHYPRFLFKCHLPLPRTFRDETFVPLLLPSSPSSDEYIVLPPAGFGPPPVPLIPGGPVRQRRHPYCTDLTKPRPAPTSIHVPPNLRRSNRIPICGYPLPFAAFRRHLSPNRDDPAMFITYPVHVFNSFCTSTSPSTQFTALQSSHQTRTAHTTRKVPLVPPMP